MARQPARRRPVRIVVVPARQPVRRRPARPVRRRRPVRRKSSSGGAIWVVVLLVVVAFFVTRGNDNPEAADTIETEPTKLAAQILALPDDIVLTGSTRVALDGYAKTGKLQNFCGDAPFQLDALLLQMLLKLQKDGYRVLVNNLGIGNDRERKYCYDKNGNRTRDQHVLGRGVDLNGIEKKGGPRTNWGDIQFRPGAELQAVQGYTDAWLALQPRNRGGVGQEGCLNGIRQPGGFQVTIPPESTNVHLASFEDGCDHLHLDVRIR